MRKAEYWESAIRRFERADRLSPPHEGAIVFVGGSSIRFWRTLADDMKPLEVVNRGFGGAQMPHVVFYASRIVIPYRPRGIVVYAGANDLGWPTRRQDATPETVLRDFQDFVSLVHGQLPDAWIYFISINPEPARWKQWPSMRQANQLVSRYAQTAEHVEYLDHSSRMLEATGRPRREIWRWDGLILNAKGYAIWGTVIGDALCSRFVVAKPQ